MSFVRAIVDDPEIEGRLTVAAVKLVVGSKPGFEVDV
jgi:hypothetical protein